MDKSKELHSSITLVNNKLNFKGEIDGMQPLYIDYTPPLGDNLGYTSLELFLFSLSSCAGSSILTLLRKMQKNISGFKINSDGFRKEDHPTCFKLIELNIIIDSPDVTDDDMKKVIKLSEETYCPVWAMIKGNVEVTINWTINK